MRTRFHYSELIVTPWRNGGGETREIISFPPQSATFDWRASIATIAQDGPFSPFPGVDRTITLLQGDAVDLIHDGGSHTLHPHQPWAFAGELPLHATLRGGVSEDFNIMTRRDSWTSQVDVTHQPCHSDHGVAWVLEGEWQSASGEKLHRGDGLWWVDEFTHLTPVSAEAKLLFTRLSRVL